MLLQVNQDAECQATKLKKRQKKCRLSFTDQCTIDDHSRLLVDVTAAFDALNDKYPGSIDAAVQKTVKRYKLLDPRFSYEVKVDGGKTLVQLSAVTSPVPFKMILKGNPEHTRKAFEKFQDFGEPLEASEHVEIELIGLPAFDKFGNKMSRVEAKQRRRCYVKLQFVVDGSITVIGTTNTEMELTPKRIKFSWQLPGCPLRFEITADILSGDQNEVATEMIWEGEAWYGKPLSHLPWLDQVISFWSMVNNPAVRLSFVIGVDGYEAEAFSGPVAVAEHGSETVAYLDLLKNAREIARITGLALLHPQTTNGNDVLNTVELHSVLSCGRYTQSEAADFSMCVPEESLHLLQQIHPSEPMKINLSQKVYNTWSTVGYAWRGDAYLALERG